MVDTELVKNEKVPETKPGIRMGNELGSNPSKPAAQESRPSATVPSGTVAAGLKPVLDIGSLKSSPETNPQSAPGNSTQDYSTQDYSTHDYDVLKRDLEQLRDDVAKIASAYTAEKQVTLKQFTDDLMKQAQSLFANAKNRGEALIKTASDSSKQATAQMEEKIQHKPFMSLLVSFLMGMMLAKIMDRD